MKSSCVKSAVLFLFAASASVVLGATNWVASTGGDLMDGRNWEGGHTPVAGDSLEVTNVPGTFTFSGTTPKLNSILFSHKPKLGDLRTLDPGSLDDVLKTVNFNVRYYDNLAILSGTYLFDTNFGVGNSTAATDWTYLTVSGDETVIRGADMRVGTGDKYGQSKGHMTVSDGALVDVALLAVGNYAGCSSSFTLSGANARLFVTNAAYGKRIHVGMSTIAQEVVGGGVTGKYHHSRDNVLMVTNQAVLVAKEVSIGSEYPGVTGNVFAVSGSASAHVKDFYCRGTNDVRVTDGGTLSVTNFYIGYGSGSAFARGSHVTVGDGGSVFAKQVLIGTDAAESTGNLFEIAESGSVWTPNLYLAGTNRLEMAFGSTLEVTNTMSVGRASSWADSTGGALADVAGVLRVPSLVVGINNGTSKDNVFRVSEGGNAVVGSLTVSATNRVVVSGTLTVTNTITVGSTDDSVHVGGSTLEVDGGTMVLDAPSTFYWGPYNKISDGNTVRVKNGGTLRITKKGSYVYIGHRGRNNRLIVTGTGSSFVHERTDDRPIKIGVLSNDTSDNLLEVSDGASLTTAKSSVWVGDSSPNGTFLIDQATATVGGNVEVGKNATSSNAVLKVKGSAARLEVNGSLTVGAKARLVFDLADAQASSAALVQLKAAPSFAAGSVIIITSSNPEITSAPRFDCDLISCTKDMDLSNVSIEIDPASGLTRRDALNPRVLRVRGGRPNGMLLLFR